MSIAKVIEISSESSDSFDAAIRTGIEKAANTVDNIQSAWVKDHIVVVKGGAVDGYRVHMNVTFTLK